MPEQDSLNTGDLASLDTYDNNTSTVADDATHPTTLTPQLSKHKRFRIFLLKILEKPSSSIWVLTIYSYTNNLGENISRNQCYLYFDVDSVTDVGFFHLYRTTRRIFTNRRDCDCVFHFRIYFKILRQCEQYSGCILLYYQYVTTRKYSYNPIDPLNIADLLSIIPFYILVILVNILGLDHLVPNLQAFRVLRLFRLVKLTQYSWRIRLLSKSIVKSTGMLLSVIYLMIVVVLVSATVMYYAERGTLNQEATAYVREDGTISPFSSIPASMW
jgi:hypothetical protein